MKLKDTELNNIKELNKRFNNLKVSLGDAELQKLKIVEEIQSIKQRFQFVESELIKKYGKDSVIDLKTGEVKKKEENA
mgnify:CR=1 FL=1|tara:strand:- start:483 stop:716 length:234 start_codon:yes stop_codon:yes gene_type:complete